MIYFEMTEPWQTNIHNERLSKTRPAGIYYADVYYANEFHGSVLEQANRVWTEKDGRINCVIPRSELVDPKEFAWLKLTATPLEDLHYG